MTSPKNFIFFAVDLFEKTLVCPNTTNLQILQSEQKENYFLSPNKYNSHTPPKSLYNNSFSEIANSDYPNLGCFFKRFFYFIHFFIEQDLFGKIFFYFFTFFFFLHFFFLVLSIITSQGRNGKIRAVVPLDNSIIFHVSNTRFCENVNREHKSNHIYFVADLKNKFLFQKCFDEDCKSINFKGRNYDITQYLEKEQNTPQTNPSDQELIEWMEKQGY